MKLVQACIALVGCVAVTLAAPLPAFAGKVQNLQSEDARFRTDPRYRTLRNIFQKIAGPTMLPDGTISLWVADPGEIADSGCEVSVGHRTWGKRQIDVSYAVCDSISFSSMGYGVLLSRDQKHLGLIIIDGGGNSGKLGFNLIIFKRTSTPIEGGRDDYFKKVQSRYL